jgi:hypothetical protein
MPKDSDGEMKVPEELLARDPNPKTATVMSLDAVLAGIDAVSCVQCIMRHSCLSARPSVSEFQLQKYCTNFT